MRKVFLLFGLVFLISVFSAAQSKEFSFGYAHLTGDIGKDGWNATGATSIAPYISIEGDLGGYYGSRHGVSDHVHTFLAGPKIQATHGAVSPFAHLLLGVGHENVEDFSSTSFTWLVGVGADLKLAPQISARVKGDLVRTNFFDNGDTHGRFGLGLVYKW